jgi:hypothetical protein
VLRCQLIGTLRKTDQPEPRDFRARASLNRHFIAFPRRGFPPFRFMILSKALERTGTDTDLSG